MHVLATPAPRLEPPAMPPARSWRGRNISLRSEAEIEAMRCAGRVVRDALAAARAACAVGVRTAEIDRAAHSVIREAGAEALFLNYPYGDAPAAKASAGMRGGFPAATCVSVNDEVVHGIPGDRVLVDGDVVTVDCGVRLDGWCADAAFTVVVDAGQGEVDSRRLEMVATAESILGEAIRLAVPGRRWSEIAARLESIAVDEGFGVIEGFVGHGIGRHLHEAPEVSCTVVGDRHLGRDFTLRPGMTIAVEPILALTPGRDGRTVATRVCEDGWTVVTVDRVVTCHVEHTIAITRAGASVLTA